jgi:ubiquinone/menaquinone biosynthesis C-methylase UbiE
MIDATLLSPYDRLTLPMLQEIVGWLGVGPGMRVLDVGCGPGTFAALAADAGAEVVAVDVSAGVIETAKAQAARLGLAERISFETASLLDLPFEAAQFDLVWASMVIHHIEDPVAAMTELGRVLKPGGRIAIREGGLPLRLLPFDIGIGEPGLQDRLKVASNQWFAAMQRATLGKLPYPYGWLRLLRDGGFSAATVKSFAFDACAPFEPWAMDMLARRLRHTYERMEYGDFLSAEDRALIETITDPASPHALHHRDDLHLQLADSIYAGVKPA